MPSISSARPAGKASSHGTGQPRGVDERPPGADVSLGHIVTAVTRRKEK